MGKKRKNKEDSRLRAQVEFLKAQLKNRPADISVIKNSSLVDLKKPDTHHLDSTLLKADLKRAFILTIAAAFILVAAFLLQSYGPTAGGN